MPKKSRPTPKPRASRKPPVRSKVGKSKVGKSKPVKSKARNRSWLPGRKGQGGEGLSKGYGGSAGAGTGASGPEQGDDAEIERRFQSLPSRERIARVLR
jgi:hypothetical protein